MSAVTGASVYQEFTITSSDNKKVVSIIGGVIDFQYYEDLYSPVTTAIIQISNTGNTVDGQGLYYGLPIKGGERVNFKIKTPIDSLIDKGGLFEYVMYVDKVTNHINDRQGEFFILHLVSRESITNDQCRVTRKYVDRTIDQCLAEIIGLVEPLQPVNFEKTENIYPFFGNMRKPFTWAMQLASKAIPVDSKSKSAGFFFWQTKRGFNFRSIDGLIKFAIENKATVQKYYYRQDMRNQYEGTNATGILDFKENKAVDLSNSLNRGEFSSYRVYFNPLDFTFTPPNEARILPDPKTYLGEKEDLPLIVDPENIPATMWAPRVLSGVYNVGTLVAGVSTAISYNPLDEVAQGASRYSSFFNIDYTVTVPVNTNLCAGDPVFLELPKTTVGTQDIDRKQSGLYIIKEITHKFLPNKSYTCMRVVRDHHGINTQK